MTAPTARGPLFHDIDSGNPPVFWHTDSNCENLVLDIMEQLDPTRFVETGTHLGWTCMWLAERYPHLSVSSVEIDSLFYGIAQHNCKAYPNIKLYNMSSPDFLALIYPQLRKGLTFFSLDAHWWRYTPLKDECKIISTLDKYVVIVDDFACKNPDFGGDLFPDDNGVPLVVENNIDYLGDTLGKKFWRPDYPEPKPNGKGYALFLKGVNYEPPKTMKLEGG